MNDAARGDAAAAWSKYWQSGQQHSCFNDGKPLKTEGYWTPFFATLVPGSRVLDLACGAGALTRLAVAYPGGFAVSGADYAEGLPDLPGAQVKAGVRLEALPFSDASFDAVISQFGIEYSDLSLSLGEAGRVLKPGGKVCFLCHAAEGEAVAAASARRSRMAGLLVEGGLVRAVEDYGSMLAAARDAPPDPKPVADVFKRVVPGPHDETTSWAVRFLAEVMDNATRFEPAYFRDNVATVRREIEGQIDRLELMLAAAMDAAGAARLVEQSAEAGMIMAELKRVIDIAGAQTGWWLSGNKNC